MRQVSYCPVCGTETDEPVEAFRPYIDCEKCDDRIYMEVWTYN